MIPFFGRRPPAAGEGRPPLRQQAAALRLVPRFLVLMWRTKPSYCLAIVVMRVGRAFGPLALLWVSKLIVDGVVASSGKADPDWRRLAGLVALELFLAVFLAALGRVSRLVENLLEVLFVNDMSVALMRHAGTLELERFEDPDFYDSLDRARQQVTGRMTFFSSLLTIGQRFLTLASLLTALIAYNVWLLAILVVAILPSFFGEAKYAAKAYALLFRLTPERRELDYLRLVASSDATAKEIKLFGLSDYFVRRYADLAERHYRENLHLSVTRTASGILLSSISTVAYYGAVMFIVVQAVRGEITVGTLTFLMATFSQSHSLLSSFLGESASVYEQSLFLRDLFGFLDMRPRLARPARPRPVPRPIRRGFTFEDVGFRYPGRESWTMRHVSFELRPRERIALVGENGAGKTTLVKLLTRLYEPTEGRILLDGVDLREYDPDELWGEMGVIFQDFVQYDLRARENIGLGRIEALHDEERILRAARSSLAMEVLDGLEGRLDQMLGRRFDGGTNLSGGQWQKIALARAYMRDAQVLILDEPTAALDAQAEYEMFRRFSELTAGRMAVLISHRFSTARLADRILVLRNGRVLEEGSHDQLIALGGRYAELFSLQAAGYR
ncbi:MAG TPA: ABC transporter ATP-binding protein [Longimicrobium sp.]|nr:ABC transporter ATP-binding protein [Longimicrobium sp.]